MTTNNASSAPRKSYAISVSELNRQARTLLERSFLTIEVEGEISNFVKPSSGHWYFTLKDDKAQVRCAMFRNRNQLIRFNPKQGDKVVVRAKVSLYEGRGDYQLICDFMQQGGTGSLQAEFEALKLKLQSEGLFETQHKQPLPEHPRHIGIITSATGAAIHDILTVLKRRYPGLPVTLYPTAVQGDEAPAQICRAIILAEAHNRCDVLIIGRGGGSLEDLNCFNNEQVAHTLFECEIPVISAVGHEVDVVITDFIADIRAATPSAAAELVSPDQHQLSLKLQHLKQRLERQQNQKLLQQQQRLDSLRNRLRHPGEKLQHQAQQLDQLELRLNQSIRQKLLSLSNRLSQLQTRLLSRSPDKQLNNKQLLIDNLRQRLQQATLNKLRQSDTRLKALAGILHTVSPLATLERGYAIVKDDTEHIATDANHFKPGDKIEVVLHKGRLDCTVNTAQDNNDA